MTEVRDQPVGDGDQCRRGLGDISNIFSMHSRALPHYGKVLYNAFNWYLPIAMSWRPSRALILVLSI